jgi:glutathione S-transferase
MRARFALIYAQIPFERREIELRNKPLHMLQLSPKGTVPVLLTSDQRVIDQSIDIMYWALNQFDPDGWLPFAGSEQRQIMESWIEINDGPFKKLLDIYKYPQRFPEEDPQKILEQAMELYFFPLNQRLEQQTFLLGDHITMLDVALFPFVRQFVGVDPQKMDQLPLKALLDWLHFFVTSDVFRQVMAK